MLNMHIVNALRLIYSMNKKLWLTLQNALDQACATFFTGGPISESYTRAASIFIG